MDIILIGRVAEDGILELIEKNSESIAARYSGRYFSEGLTGLEAEFGDDRCMRMLNSAGADVFVIGKQGIFDSLYKLGQTCDTGFRVDLAAIRISQFCIEIADLFDVNPYKLSSLGCILVRSADGNALAAALREEGYPAAVIGYTTEEKACCVTMQDKVMYLGSDK